MRILTFFLILDIAVRSGILGTASWILWTVAALSYVAVGFVTTASGDD